MSLLFLFLFELGILNNNCIFYNNINYYIENIYYLDAKIELLIQDHFFIQGRIENYAFPDKYKFGMKPFYINYYFGAGFRINIFEIGYKHQCGHPILTRTGMVIDINNAYNQFYVRMESKIKLE